MAHHRSLRLSLIGSLAFAVAACGGGTPAASPLTDPVDIVVRSVETLSGTKTFHVDAALSGSVNVDMFGSGSTSAFPLDNTTATLDVDLENSNAKASFAAPGLLGLSGELIQIGTTSYFKTSLTGNLFQKQESQGEPPTSEAADISAEDLDKLREELARPEVAPTKGEDVTCGDKECYAVVFDLTSAELQELGAGELPTDELPTDLSEASLTMTLHVEKDTLRPAALILSADLGAEGSLELEIKLSRWNETVSVSAPPDDQVQQ